MTASAPPEAPPQRPADPKRTGRTFLAIALVAFVVFFVGPCTVLGLISYEKRKQNAIMNEARATLADIAKHAAAAIDRDGRPCPSASKPVPADIGALKKKGYRANAEEWKADAERKAGFACLGFVRTEPQHFQYDYRGGADAPAGDAFEAFARGDVGLEGKISTFRIHGSIVNGRGTFSPNVEEINPAP